PFAQNYLREMTLQARAAVPALSLAPALRSVARAVNADAFVREISTLDHQVTQALVQPRMTALSAGVLSLMALALAAAGLYSIIAYSVARRSREIGVRMALGAQPYEIRKLVLGEGLTLAAIGSALGLAGAAASTRLLSAFLYGVSVNDAATF